MLQIVPAKVQDGQLRAPFPDIVMNVFNLVIPKVPVDKRQDIDFNKMHKKKQIFVKDEDLQMLKFSQTKQPSITNDGKIVEIQIPEANTTRIRKQLKVSPIHAFIIEQPLKEHSNIYTYKVSTSKSTKHPACRLCSLFLDNFLCTNRNTVS